MNSGSFRTALNNSTFVRTMNNFDPAKCGISLQILDLPSIHKWMQEINVLQKKHPYEELPHCLLISENMALRINAWNVAHHIIEGPIICGNSLDLDNKKFFDLLLQIVLPKTEQEWIANFKKLATFRKLPHNQHLRVPDVTNFDDWFAGYLTYIYEANAIKDLMSSLPDRDMTPVMKSYGSKKGLMELFYEQIPMDAGKNIHKMIDYAALKECHCLKDYTVLFQTCVQLIQDGSDSNKLNRSRMSPMSNNNEEQENTKLFQYKNNFNNYNEKKLNNNNNNNKFIDNNNNNNNNRFNNNNFNKFNSNSFNSKNTALVPYRNPHEGKLNNLYDVDKYYDQRDHNIYQDYNDDDDYNNDEDYNDDDYNYEDTFGSRLDTFEGLNSGHNVTNHLSYIDRSSDFKQKQPCFDEIYGKCSLGKNCKFSHDFKELQKEAIRKHADINNSKYLPRTPQQQVQPTSILKRDPTSNLRSMATMEEQYGSKVSNNINSIHINNNRDNSDQRDGEDHSSGASHK
jgi:hypothetical protein